MPDTAIRYWFLKRSMLHHSIFECNNNWLISSVGEVWIFWDVVAQFVAA